MQGVTDHLQLFVFVEEPSAETALRLLLPKMIGDDVAVEYRVFQGKSDLLERLPRQLRSYATWLTDSMRIVVLVDEDREDCLVLKRRLEKAAAGARLATPASATGERFVVLNRIAVEELEAWYLGDPVALRACFGKLPESFEQRERYRDPDAVAGGTWEALERLLNRHGTTRGV